MTEDEIREPNPVAPWELRLGNPRVYYDVETGPDGLVMVWAVGVKDSSASAER